MGTYRTHQRKIRNYDDDGGDDDSDGGCNNEQRKPIYQYYAREPDIIIRDTCRKVTDFMVWCSFSDDIPELQNMDTKRNHN
jgi:hypothetical protein